MPKPITPAPTLIVFTREPVAGEAKTRLIPRLGPQHAAALARAFTLDALTKAQALGLPILIAGTAQNSACRTNYFRKLARGFSAGLVDQGSGTLGARMARTLEPFCDAGAVLIGTDAPSLPQRLLARSVALLRQAPVVLAPSLDGGYYLVGVRGRLPDIFRGVRWGGSHALADSIKRLKRLGVAYALGPAWYDVDRWSDLILLVAHLSRLTNPAAPPSLRGSPRRTTNAVRRSHPCPATAHLLARLGLLSP